MNAEAIAIKSPGSLFWNERLRLAALSRFDLMRIALVAMMIGIVFVMFHYQGNTTDLRTYGRSAILWMIQRWQDSGMVFGGITDYSHGSLIPFVSLGVVWLKRRELRAAPKEVSMLGLAFLVGFLALHWIGARSQHSRVSLFALAGILWSVPYYLFGKKVAAILLFPCAYLIFCIPLNFLDDLSFPLRHLATVSSVWILNGLGMELIREGTAIHSTAGLGFALDVDDPCSGLRSLLAMTALTAVYAYFTQRTLLKKWILFLAAVPLAVIGNVARVITICLVAASFGEYASLIYHDWSGYIVFAVAIALMIALGNFLDSDPKQVLEKWKKRLLHPTSSSSP